MEKEGKKRGPGRPVGSTKENSKEKTIVVRVTEQEYELLKQASVDYSSLSKFVRAALLWIAEEKIPKVARVKVLGENGRDYYY